MQVLIARVIHCRRPVLRQVLFSYVVGYGDSSPNITWAGPFALGANGVADGGSEDWILRRSTNPVTPANLSLPNPVYPLARGGSTINVNTTGRPKVSYLSFVECNPSGWVFTALTSTVLRAGIFRVDGLTPVDGRSGTYTTTERRPLRQTGNPIKHAKARTVGKNRNDNVLWHPTQYLSPPPAHFPAVCMYKYIMEDLCTVQQFLASNLSCPPQADFLQTVPMLAGAALPTQPRRGDNRFQYDMMYYLPCRGRSEYTGVECYVSRCRWHVRSRGRGDGLDHIRLSRDGSGRAGVTPQHRQGRAGQSVLRRRYRQPGKHG